MRKISYDEFVQRAKLKHDNKYNYSKVDLTNGFHAPVKIFCPQHGEFLQTPSQHLSGNGCPKCAIERVHNNQRKSTETFVKEVQKIFGDKYDFSKVIYTGAKNKVAVVCPEHGEFYIRPNDLLNGHGCPSCAKVKPLTTEIFKERAAKLYGDKYGYDNVKYKNLSTHVLVTCKQHGDFPITPANFFSGYGCPKCNQSHLEKGVECFLNEHNIEFVYQYKPRWGGNYRYDFYLPTQKTIIECQGRQHFSPIDYFKGENGFQYLKNNDIKKFNLCKQNGINIFYLLFSKNAVIPEELKFMYTPNNTFYNINDLWNKAIRINENKTVTIKKSDIVKAILEAISKK